jgi:hypothetical protein
MVVELRHQGERVIRALSEENGLPSALHCDRRLIWCDGQWRVDAWTP